MLSLKVLSLVLAQAAATEPVASEPVATTEPVAVSEPVAVANPVVTEPAPVVAETPPPEDAPFSFNLAGTYRISGASLSPMRVDADGNTFGQSGYMDHRLSFTPEARWRDTLKVVADVQLSSGYLAIDDPETRLLAIGPPRDAAASAFGQGQRYLDQLHLRKLYLDWTTPIGVLLLGRMASQWGLGLLANSGDGAGLEWGEVRFGIDRNYGDIVDRVIFATAPVAFVSQAPWAREVVLALGGNLLVRDERFMRSEGDRAAEAVGVLRWQRDDNTVGAYVAYRDLDDGNDDTLNVWAYDLFAKGKYKLTNSIELHGAGELVFLSGATTLGRNNAVPVGELDIKQLGYVARAGATFLPWSLGGDVELGYASGDSNSNDGYLRNFTFDPDYNPSLIMFDELRAAETVSAVAQASDPSRVGYPPRALKDLPTQGGVSNAIYLKPTVRYGFAGLVEGLAGRVAVLFARSEEAVVDPFNSTVAGGIAKNFQGGNGNAKNLGVEVDVGVDYTYELPELVEVRGSLQGGQLWPGDAFADANGVRPDPIQLVFAKVGVRWLPEKRPASATK